MKHIRLGLAAAILLSALFVFACTATASASTCTWSVVASASMPGSGGNGYYGTIALYRDGCGHAYALMSPSYSPSSGDVAVVNASGTALASTSTAPWETPVVSGVGGVSLKACGGYDHLIYNNQGQPISALGAGGCSPLNAGA